MKYILIIISGSMIGFYLSNTNLSDIDILSKKIITGKIETIECRISEAYKETSLEKKYICGLKKIGDRTFQAGEANILINNLKGVDIHIGDNLSSEGKISPFKNSSDFSYSKYMLLRNTFGQINSYNFKILSNDSSIYIKSILNIKKKFLSVIEEIYPGDSARLLAGIFLGIKSDFSKETLDNFNRSGLSHIIAVSGFNITILIIFFSFLFRSFPGYLRLPLVVGIIFVFLSLVGTNSSALRAGIMGILGFLSVSYGRQMNIGSLVLLTLMIFALMNPLTLNYDISFQLSFLALIGLIIFGNIFTEKLTFLPKRLGIREGIATTIAVLVFTLPIMLVNFGTLSIISPVSNIIAVPFVSPIMLVGFISIIVYFVFPTIAIYIGFFEYLMLKTLLKTAELLGNLPLGVLQLDLGTWKYHFLMAYYLLLFFIIMNLFLDKFFISHRAQSNEVY